MVACQEAASGNWKVMALVQRARGLPPASNVTNPWDIAICSAAQSVAGAWRKRNVLKAPATAAKQAASANAMTGPRPS